MSSGELREGSALVDGRAITEVSGSITPATAETGGDLLSIGWITHSAPTLDIDLDCVREA
ncbi:hypothetical protein [Sinorhizobium sp. 8-89]|uniref:hypothetical protein n=1 Tax=Sinorhizobium sp. 8-89 TaxID=3049089 RepID=UPI00386FE027